MMLETKTCPVFLHSTLVLLVLFFHHIPSLCLSQETNTNFTIISSLRDDSNTISSPSRVFQLGFFSPPNNTNRYLAIYYTFSPETVIWIANRDQPLNDSSGHFIVAPDGNLLLTNRWNDIVWSTNINGSSLGNNTSAKFHDTGNLIVNDTSTGTILWESFSQPSNFLVPMMKLSDNPSTHTRVSISSWKSPSDPGVGIFTSGIGGIHIPQLFVWQDGQPIWRSGPWNGRFFSGIEVMYSPYMQGFVAPEGQFIAPNGEYIPQTWEQNGTVYFIVPEGQFLVRDGLNSTGNESWKNSSKKPFDTKYYKKKRPDLS